MSARIVTAAGRQFTRTATRDAAMWLADYQGAPWWHFDTRHGDGPSQTRPGIDDERNRLDGNVQRDVAGAIVEDNFVVQPGDGFMAEGPRDWNCFYERHAIGINGEREQSGPVKLSAEWSAWAKAPVVRAYRQWGKFDGNRIVGVEAASVAIPDFDPRSKHQFRIRYRQADDDSGFLEVWHFYNRLINYRGPFGYGEARSLYPQYGIYRNARRTRSFARFLISPTIIIR